MRSLLCLLALLSVQIAVDAADETLIAKEWEVNGVTRHALLHIPATAVRSETPVVFAFHGHGGSMLQASRSFSYHTIWPEAMVVYLQGLKTPGTLTDPEGKRFGWQSGPGDQEDRDLKFFDAVLASLRSDYKVDEKRIYATGHSNGGGFTYLLWYSRNDVFAAVAPSAAVPSAGARDLKPKPVLHVAGETDPLVKWDWQKLTIDLLRKRNGCDSVGKAWDKSNDLTGTIYASKTGTPVVTLIHPGGHKFHADAPELIVKFFKEQAKK